MVWNALCTTKQGIVMHTIVRVAIARIIICSIRARQTTSLIVFFGIFALSALETGIKLLISASKTVGRKVQ